MDPRLQRLMTLQQHGVRKVPTSSTLDGELAVLARVSSVSQWEALSEVRIGARIGEPDDRGGILVTARIPVARIDAVRKQPFVLSLKAAQLLTPALHATIEETRARADLLPEGHLAAGGDGVVVGIVDFGCDFAHRNFRTRQGRTRIEALWDQGGQTRADSPMGYGRLYTREEIDHALKSADPYGTLGYGPPPDSAFSKGSHGTHVADIAAGNGLGSGTPGVAPEADIIFVEVASSDVPWTGPQVVGKSFGDSVQLLEAVQFIFDRAGDRPCVINLSLGTNGGPHDGSMLVEQGIDSAMSQAANRAVVIAASNSHADGIHAAGTVAAGEQHELRWIVPQSDFTHNEMEIWYPQASRLAAELLMPDGRSLGTVPAGENGVVNTDHGVALFVANRLNDPNNGDNVVGIFMERGLPAGGWTVRLHGDPDKATPFHAWIERDDASPSQFQAPLDNSHTVGSISTGNESIVVGSYDAHRASVPLSFFSSEGPTRDGRQKPEVSAPGHAVLAAHSRTGDGVVRKSGTSMASPAVTGVIALMLAEAQARGISLDIAQIRGILTRTARQNPPSGAGWDSRYGHGRVSASAAVAEVMALAAPPAPAGGRRRATRGQRKK
jgi:subtilisin family serine protease